MTVEARPVEHGHPEMARLRRHLDRLYPASEAARAYEELSALLARYQQRLAGRGLRAHLFDESDVVLITYADQVSEPGRAPLASLREFLLERVAGVVTGVHLLPCYPSTSDDGFAVSDFSMVDPRVGTWADVEAVSRDFRLMLDAVFNHVSSRSEWVARWREGDEHYRDFFVVPPPGADVSAVTRPRPTPVLTSFETAAGTQEVWTTFSADQVDLNYANPRVLITMTGFLLEYLARGADIIRLDAVAFLWKRWGSTCVHLPETHEIVRLWRTVVDLVAPGTLLITETNVPHGENVSYFGTGDDEAHLVYQFPLAPLVLSAFHLADASVLQEWAASLATPSDSTTFFNFLGSHDGVGLRPAEGLLTSAEIQQLCDLSRAHGGGVSWKTNQDGSLSPYELNTVYFDALTEVDSTESEEMQVARFLAAQSMLLALAGVPGISVQALLGSRNWHEGVERYGTLRSINREKFDRSRLEGELDAPGSLRNQVFHRLLERIRLRVNEPAFHPSGAQRVLAVHPAVFAFEREAVDGSSAVLCLHNLSGREHRLSCGAGDGLTLTGPLRDLVTGERITVGAGGAAVTLEPYGVRWFRTDV